MGGARSGQWIGVAVRGKSDRESVRLYVLCSLSHNDRDSMAATTATRLVVSRLAAVRVRRETAEGESGLHHVTLLCRRSSLSVT